MQRSSPAALLALLVVVSGCTAAGPKPGGVSSTRVTGTLTYRERIALPATAAVLVQLIDVSRADAPAVVIAEQFIDTKGRQVPFAFELAPYPTAIVASHTYVVQARIEDRGQLLFVTDRRHPVLTGGAPNEIVVTLRSTARSDAATDAP